MKTNGTISGNRRALRRFTFVKRSFSEVRLFSERRLAHFTKRYSALSSAVNSRQNLTNKSKIMNLKKIFTKKDRAKALVKTDVSSSILSDDDFKQFEKLFDKISAHLKHPMSICQGVNDGYSIGVYDIKTGELKTQAMSYNVKNCVNLIKERL